MTSKSFFAKCLKHSLSHRYFHTPSVVVRVYDFGSTKNALNIIQEFSRHFPLLFDCYHCYRVGSIVTIIFPKYYDYNSRLSF